MIDREALTEVVTSSLEGTGLFVVEVTVSRDNVVEVLLDSMDGSVGIDDCVAVNDAVLAAFDRDVEDYELTVGSYGLTSPYKVRAQWLKNVGNQVEVLTGDGLKLHGTLKAVGDEEFTLAVPTRVKPEGKKRPVTQDVDHTMRCDEIKYIKNIITI